MRIVLLKPVVVAGHPGASVGDVLDVPSATFQVLEGLGAARLAADAEPARVTPPEAIESRDPEPETRDPAPKKSRSKKAEG